MEQLSGQSGIKINLRQRQVMFMFHLKKSKTNKIIQKLQLMENLSHNALCNVFKLVVNTLMYMKQFDKNLK